MRYVVTALACGVVACITALTVLSVGSHAVDPPPVQLADDGRSTQRAAQDHSDRPRSDRPARARADAAGAGTRNRSATPSQPSATTPSSTSRVTPAAAPATTAPVVSDDDDGEYEDD
jgi:hypothetical protein